MFYTKCSECERVFDLLNEQDAQEWEFGHDCEVQPEPATTHIKLRF